MQSDSEAIKFSEWKWEDGREQKSIDVDIDTRCDEIEFNVSPDNLKSYEDNLKWESEMAFHCLNEVRKRKFFAINASMILFPGLIGGFIAAATYLEKVGFAVNSSNSASNHSYGYFWVSAVIISMFIGMANMISIKYIAAFKAQSNLLIRQLNCLRQALDSVTYYKFEGKYPVHLLSMVEGGVYYKVFGKHRKLPIGNDSFRNRLIGSYSESADKSLIGFLFISSSTLLSAPFIYLIAISSNYWNIIEDYHLPMLSDKSIAIGLTMFMILCSITVFIVAHWDNFKKLRTADGTPDLSKEIAKAPDVLFKFVSLDYISGALLLIPAVYWFFLSFNTSNANYNIILQFLSLVSLGLFFICVNKVFFDSLNRIHRSLTYKSSVKVRTKKS